VHPPGYRFTPSTLAACKYCAQRVDIDRMAICARYECLTYLNSVCDTFELLGEREPVAQKLAKMSRVDGPWMRYPDR
jgi:hypothetical protein